MTPLGGGSVHRQRRAQSRSAAGSGRPRTSESPGHDDSRCAWAPGACRNRGPETPWSSQAGAPRRRRIPSRDHGSVAARSMAKEEPVQRFPHRVSRRRALTSILVTGLIASGVVPANAASGGFKTARPAMLVGVAPGSSVTPLLTVGDVITTDDGEFRLESIPDGISLATRGSGRVDLY